MSVEAKSFDTLLSLPLTIFPTCLELKTLRRLRLQKEECPGKVRGSLPMEI